MELELESILLPGIEDKRPMVIAGPYLSISLA